MDQPNDNLNNTVNNTNSDIEYGPREVSLFTLFAKTMLGFVGGICGSLILLLIFLAGASILQPVLNPAAAGMDQINPIFMVLIMAMIFLASMTSSMLTPWLFSYTERERYPRLVTATYQIFLLNIVIFVFTAPLYLTSSAARLELIAYAAGLQIVIVSLSAALIMEILNDQKYPLLDVYTSVVGVLIATALNLLIFQLFKSTTVLLFTALPIIWASIGFFQAALAMTYNWYYLNWGNDFLAANQNYGLDYGKSEEEETEIEEEENFPDDTNGQDFLKS